MAGQVGDSAVTDASGNTIVDALLWDRHWANRNLTFQIPTTATGYGYGVSGFGALLAQQNTAVREVLASYSAVSLLTFQEVTTNDARLKFARADAVDRNVNGTYESTSAYNETVGTAYGIPPDPDSYDRREWGDMWFNDNPAGGTNDMTDPVKGTYAYHTIIHEIGHVLGMDHPHGDAGIGDNFGNLPSNWDSMEFSVMTYRSFVGDTAGGGYGNEGNSYAQSLMAVDIAAIQNVYGANYGSNATDTVYKWRPTTGNMEINGVAQDAATAPDGNRIFRTIWDGGGVDTYDFSSYGTNLGVDLRPGTSDDPNVGWTTTSTVQLARLGTDAAGQAVFARGNIANAWLVIDDTSSSNYLRPLIENAVGGTGNDTIRGNNANNRLDGGQGNDTLFGGLGFDTLIGGGGIDRLFGEQDRDFLVSGAGATYLDGGDGLDFADYSASTTDVYVDFSIGKVLGGFAQDDTLVSIEGLVGSRFDDSLGGNDSQNELRGGGGDDTLQGYGGSDTLQGDDGSDILIGGAGFDTLDGGIGFDTASYEGSVAVTIDVDARTYGGAAANDTLISIERIAGSSVADSIAGSAASESFAGRAGADALYGRGGSDTLEGGAGGDTLDGGDGSDWISYAGSTAGVYVDFSFQGGKVLYGDAQGDTLVSIENIEGSGYDDTLVGGTAADQIWGQGGADQVSGNDANDQLAGHGGDDTLVGGAGADYMDGGDGSDWAYYSDSNAGVTIDISAGKIAGIGGTAEGDALVDFENIRGSIYSDRITGSAASNWLVGLDGNDTLFGLGASDTLDGGAGEDSLDGGAGDDLVQLIASAGDRVAGGGGVDRLVLTRAAGAAAWSFDYATGRGSDGFAADGFTKIDVYGGDASETITGGATADVMSGGAGIDRLLGGLQNDTLEGGAGADTIDGGAGIDWADYATAPAGVTVNLSTGVHTGVAAGDTLIAIENLGGSAFGDVLTGNAAGNALSGRGGTDRLVGLGGADTLDGGDGSDTADYSGSNAAVVVDLTTGLGTGGTAQGDRLVFIERLIGSAFGDRLTGNGDANVLTGGLGQDTMAGGAGIDWYYVDSSGDQVVETAGGGSDRVFTSVNHTLASGQEIERLDTTDEAGTGSINLSGNAFANTLVGNAGINILNGGLGADLLYGRGGNDVYYIDSSGDRVFEAVAGGSDRVLTSISHTLAAGQEIERLDTTNESGTGSINLSGNAFANTLVGNAGVNIIDGGAGADLLYGRGGSDFYFVDNGNDRVFEAVGGGSDKVLTSVSFTLTAGQEIERLDTTSEAGTGSINLSGNAFANTLVGNAGVNILNGGGGADLLYGRGGGDFYFVDNADDRVFEAAGGGSDKVLASVSYVLAVGQEIERLDTTSEAGTGSIDLTGNAFANTLVGNAGANILNGGGGADVLYGRGGGDTFAFSTGLGAGNVDRISDFSVPDDTIQLARSVFAALGAGPLAATAFKDLSTGATDANDRVLYDKATGGLSYDADGNGTASAAMQFAILDNKASLTHADFSVV
ncbi:hypothetical protein ASG40_19150 [Methylobacterium sp. Leaf399]|uniref:M10 family metallopeptidase n=1 Tax=Methylobacterium sp. Leaf399 TaxID=1736364 RepID=UPI0006FC43EE|nr:M10 family metallopeptidase [Methylobacterium sp. Leaf399]KQT14485.1 hypothetical protein ASG40_19150 [Methylobacterium sp. Leaf399]